jgi:hypothetical protein
VSDVILRARDRIARVVREPGRRPLAFWAILAGLTVPIASACQGPGSCPDTGADAAQPNDSADRHESQPSSEDAAVETSGFRDWKTYPAVAQFDGTSELWVLSDVHADYHALMKLLVAAHLIDTVPASPKDVRWVGGQATLVAVGDFIDKGPDAPDVIRIVIALEAAAVAAGGRVVATMGNHEAEFLADPKNDKAERSNGLDPELSSAGLDVCGTAAGDDDIGRFIRTLPIAARVDDWFFVHAGNTGGLTLARLESELESGIDAMGFAAPIVAGSDSLLEARLSSSPPQWWDATGDAAKLLTAWTAALGAKHLVMGHQPGKVGFADGTKRSADEMTEHYSGRIFLVDTGMSVDVDDTGGALLHVVHVGTASESFTEVKPDGSVHTL